VSAWHAHGRTTDRLFVSTGQITLALYDGRQASPTYGLVSEFQLSVHQPQLVVVPPGVWHGLIVGGTTPTILLNLTDQPYSYEAPDHWRLPPDTDRIPYSFNGSRPALGADGG
jgi:dTDP-4-dehydrorhamnose 3,5-epimerase